MIINRKVDDYHVCPDFCQYPVQPRLLSLSFDFRTIVTIGIKPKEGESAAKLLTAFVRKAEESALGKLIVEAVILLSARTQNDGGKILRAAAQVYKVDTDAIALKVKHEFAAKEKSKGERKPQAVAKPAQKRVA